MTCPHSSLRVSRRKRYLLTSWTFGERQSRVGVDCSIGEAQKMFQMLMTLLVVVLLCVNVAAFNVGRSVTTRMQRSNLKMEYIPEGFSKQQWQALKDKEAADKKKNLGQLGVGKFKSRSFEAWQKSGGKHLFPVDPNNSKYEERPYMQRRGGDWEGGDLKVT